MQTSKPALTLTLLAAMATFSGCANLDKKASEQMSDQVSKARAKFDSKGGFAVVDDRPYVGARIVDYEPELTNGNTRVDAMSVPLGDLISPLAKQLGYGVQILQGVDPKRRVTIQLRDADLSQAIRQVTFAAGYVAVFDARERMIRIVEEAILTFRVPPQAMNPTSPSLNMDIRSSPNSGNQSSASASINAAVRSANASAQGGNSGAGGGAASTGASGASGGGAVTSAASMQMYLDSLLGPGAKTIIMQDAGTISVRGKGYQLKRAKDFLERFVSEGTRRVMVEVVIAEVSLSKDLEFGIDWSRIVPVDRSGASTAISLSNAIGVVNPALSIATTTRSIASVLKALETRTQVRVLSSPSLLLSNNTPGQASKFTSRSYVPSVTSTPVSTGTTTNTISSTAALSEVPEGTTLTAVANIVDSNKAWVTLLAQSNDVLGQQIFNPSKDVTLTALIQSKTQVPISLLAEHGKTLVIGGMRTSRDSKNGKGVPLTADIPLVRELLNNVSDLSASSEVVVMLHITVQPSPRVDVVIGENI